MSMRPRRWWRCALDVEGLALGAVEAARSATQMLATRRGIDVDVTTSSELIAASFSAMEHLRIEGRATEPWAPLSGFVQTRDGWVRLHGNYPHHAASISTALTVTTRDELDQAGLGMSAQEIEDKVVQAGGVATVVRTEQQWAAHPHAKATATKPWLSVEPGGAGPVLTEGDLPLSGIRVLDLTRVIAGPTCSQLLACLGADVLRIDPPDRPELLDQYLSNGMGKRSAAVDLSVDAETVRTDLLPRADVVLVGYRPGALDRFGFDASSLSSDDPHLVVASLSAWGEDGPWGHRPGFDSIVQAATGIADKCAGPDGRPGTLPVQALDHATGYLLAAGVMALLGCECGGIVRANLLGAARLLLEDGRRESDSEVKLDVPTVSLDSPYGLLATVAPPIMLNGRTLARDIERYAAAAPTWEPAR